MEIIYSRWKEDQIQIDKIPEPDSVVLIPEEEEGLSVTALGAYVCSGSEIEEVHIPIGVKKIGAYAFYGCQKLKAVYMGGRALDLGTGLFADTPLIRFLDFTEFEDGFMRISDLNNLKIVTTTSNEYASVFGFTEKEVFDALEQYGLEKEKKEVKRWYDGFIFGEHKDIYNPWSILNYLDTQLYKTFWANTSANSLVGKLIQEGNRTIKEKFEKLLCGEYIWSEIEEQIVYNQLNGNEKAVWSLLLASGYLKVLSYETYQDIEEGKMPKYQLALTNLEVKLMFQGMVHDWFAPVQPDYNDFVRAMLLGDVDAMNEYMNRIAIQTFSYFDTGERASGAEPERFYHGFVLGLLVDLRDRYYLKSNRESGFGRYDVMLEPKNSKECKAVILEFKVRNPRKEKSIQETVLSALKQICEKKYDADLLEKGIRKEQIYHYGFAFEGKKVLIGTDREE